jgi:glycosyltransferase involved in cell wall biosynthesis
MLLYLLEKLQNQKTEQLFTYSIIVVDNDYIQSAKSIVEVFKEKSAIDIKYYCEPEQNISLARNKALQGAEGNFIAWIDDDEFPEKNWLLNLYEARKKYNADGVLGPVKPCFEKNTPKWVINGRFYEKNWHKTGNVLEWQDTRTSNVLMKNSIFENGENLFNPELGRGGEDKDFFKRMIDKNYVFIWCNEALVYETIPPERCKRVFMLKRALLRGKIFLKYPSFGLIPIVKSTIAIPIYALILPFAFLLGHHYFMNFSIKLFEHIGRLLALCGLDVVKQYYVMK